MINVNVKYADNTVSVDFPCDGNVLEAKLMELHVDNMRDVNLFIEKVNDNDTFKFLEDTFVNLDELNYMAEKLCNLNTNDIPKFDCVANELNMKNLKELINLSMNLHRYTLIQDLSSPESVGRVHYNTTHIDASGGDISEESAAVIGKNLINSGRGRMTEAGMLFINDELPNIKTFNGIPFPENLYGGKCIEIEISDGENKHNLWLPETPNTLIRYLAMIDTDTELAGYMVKISDFSQDDEEWFERIKNILNDDGLEALNRVATAINTFYGREELEKLSAVIEYADVSDAESIATLGENLDKFVFIPDANSPEEVADYMLDVAELYHIDVEIREYFMEEQFGEDVMRSQQGNYVNNGIVMMNECNTLSKILDMVNNQEQDEDQGMTFGAM